MTEKQEFSRRLRAAMEEQRLIPTAAVLEREFNKYWSGAPVRRQTAWKWLNGKAIPTHDKLQDFARRFKVEPHTLRFGEQTLRHLRVEQNAGTRERVMWRGRLSTPFCGCLRRNAS